MGTQEIASAGVYKDSKGPHEIEKGKSKLSRKRIIPLLDLSLSFL